MFLVRNISVQFKFEDGHGAGNQRRDEIDHDKNDQELHAQRAAMPQCLRDSQRRMGPRGRSKNGHLDVRLRADERFSPVERVWRT